MATYPKLNFLEQLALNALPEQARVAQLVSRYRKGEFGGGCVDYWRMTRKKAKEILDCTDEPYGRRGWLVTAFMVEHERQRKAANSRIRCTGSDLSELNAATKRRIERIANKPNRVRAELDKEQKRLKKNYTKQRLRRIAARKLYDYSDDLLTSRAPSYWCSGKSNGVNCSFTDVKISKGVLYVVMTPSYWRMNDGSHLREHKVRFLIVKDGTKAPVAIRVQYAAATVKDAIASLEIAMTKKLVAKGHKLSIDWAKQCFLLKSKRRKVPREVPFKRWERKERS
jgi:hypothetical protein